MRDDSTTKAKLEFFFDLFAKQLDIGEGDAWTGLGEKLKMRQRQIGMQVAHGRQQIEARLRGYPSPARVRSHCDGAADGENPNGPGPC